MKKFRISILIPIVLLIITMLYGYFIPKAKIPIEQSIFYQILQPYAELYKPYNISTVIFLFLKNTLVVFIAFFLSPILLISPIFVIILNGFMTGYIASILPIDIAIKALAPHGIFELSALVIASSSGFRFGYYTIMKLIKHKEYKIIEILKKEIKWIYISLILLLIAAIIESFITPFLIGL
ncbi:MAG: hypothetical protein DSO09_03135 [Candidatus Methanomethylicota archaeon]|uniref:Stage II sporulation protein M n=1 Tax=Thermoproteota archaeon TaxID=2056631 RepID=A0A523BDC2_9CREN|nr:MAG: hypothetical protein EF809_05755 [Candidatus Verstraetearchaeota archaeon]TDA38852.1 MAG: hypothetical protein DSO09_03135 [Candidatus Verstraetearchaeota archaeon]